MTRGSWATGIRTIPHGVLAITVLAITTFLCYGCGGPLPSPFAELEKTQPVSPTKIRLVAAFVDGVNQQQPAAEVVVGAKQSLSVYGTVEDGEWRFGGSASLSREGSFAWRKPPPTTLVSALTKDPPIAIFSHIHQLKNRTTLAPPKVQIASLIVAPNRNGADFDVRLTAPAKPGEYVLDLLGVGGGTASEVVAAPSPNQAIFWRAKLRVTAPK